MSLKDYSQMKSFIQGRIREAKENLSEENPTLGVDEAVEHLKESLRLVLMKPDRDHKSPSLILLLQNEIMNYRSFDVAFREVVEEAVTDFKSSRKNPVRQASLLYVLENSIAQLKSIKSPESTKALQNIANGNLKISKKMVSYLFLEMGRGEPISPSYRAKTILKERQATKRVEEARTKAFEIKQKKQSTQKITTVKETETYRESASEKESKQGLVQSFLSWFSPKKSKTEEEEQEALENKKEDYIEIIKIDL